MKICIFIKTHCPFSIEAVKISKRKSKQVYVFDLEKNGKTLKSLQSLVPKNIKLTTVPVVFVDGKFIGGCSELKHLFKL
jgi:glutaredoxin 3